MSKIGDALGFVFCWGMFGVAGGMVCQSTGCEPASGVCIPPEKGDPSSGDTKCSDGDQGDSMVGGVRNEYTCTTDSQDLRVGLQGSDYCQDSFTLVELACTGATEYSGNYTHIGGFPVSRIYKCENGCDETAGACKPGAATLISEEIGK